MKELRTLEEFEAATNQDVPVIFDFWAPWCGPCKVAMPAIEAMSNDFGDKAVFYKVNVDEAPEIAQKLSIRGIPTFMVYLRGGKVDTFVNDIPKLKAKVEALIAVVE